MTTREKFLACMAGDKSSAIPKWEYAYWGGTIRRWYEEGLPKRVVPRAPVHERRTISSSLYSFAWQYATDPIPEGLAVWGEATYWPTQGLPLDRDVNEFFGMDEFVHLAEAEHVFYPAFTPRLIEEDEESIIYDDLDGVRRKYLKKESVIPSPFSWPIDSPLSWEKIKQERLDSGLIASRIDFEALKDHRNRSYPLAIGGYPCGMFGLTAHLMGYENLFLAYYDTPELIHDINSSFTELWIGLWEEILSVTSVDVLHIFEDISSSLGTLVSPDIIREFMLPYYKRMTDFVRSHGVDCVLLDTDGNCEALIPLFLEGGITGLYPMECETGMDLERVRKTYPTLQMAGGIQKGSLRGSKESVEELIRQVENLVSMGRYIPFVDHSIPPDVSFSEFSFYRERLNRCLDT